MDVDLPGIHLASIVDLVFLSGLAVCVFARDKSRVVHVPDLLLDSPRRVSDFDDSVDSPRHVALNVKQGAIGVNLDHLLRLHSLRVGAHVARHPFALENLTGPLAHTDGTGSTMGLRDTVARILGGEVPPFDHTLGSLTLAGGLHVNTLAQLEVTRTQAIANRQVVLACDLKFAQVSLWWQIVLHKVAHLRLLDFAGKALTNAKLDGVDPVSLLGLHLGDLAAIDLDDRAGGQFTPLVPKVSHAHLVAHQTDALAVAANRFSHLQVKVLVNSLFERLERLGVVLDSVLLGVAKALVVKATLNLLLEVGQTHSLQILDRLEIVDCDLGACREVAGLRAHQHGGEEGPCLYHFYYNHTNVILPNMQQHSAHRKDDFRLPILLQNLPLHISSEIEADRQDESRSQGGGNLGGQSHHNRLIQGPLTADDSRDRL